MDEHPVRISWPPLLEPPPWHTAESNSPTNTQAALIEAKVATMLPLFGP